VSENKKRYLRLLEELKKNRREEAEILDKMGLLWQAMTLEEREEVGNLHLSWPPPAPGTKSTENEEDK